MIRKLAVIACVLLFAVLMSGCTQPVVKPNITPTTLPPTTTIPPTTVALKSIVATAVANGNFTTLLAAVNASNLTGTLSGPGPFTVFAPTDAAFNKLPAGTVATLLNDPQGQLKQILLYHVVSGKLMASGVVNQTNLTTLQGSKLNVTVSGSVVKVDNATVIIADVQCSNGVIHVIDTVMIPPK
jgi:transforming growth factor-beta-induced protein